MPHVHLQNSLDFRSFAGSLSCYLLALAASGGEFLLVALCAVDLFILGDERLRADRVFARRAAETFVMPLLALVFHLFHS